MRNSSLIFFALILIIIPSCNDDETTDPVVMQPVGLSIEDISTNEGDTYSNLSVKLKLDAASTEQITAIISSSDGTAEAGTDYIAFSNESVIFAAGETEKEYEMVIIGDQFMEDAEAFEISIQSVTGPATITDSTATVSIIDEDMIGVKTIDVAPVIDWDALLALPVGSEPSYDVFNFGQPASVPNAEYTSVVEYNDFLAFKSRINSQGDTILYDLFNFAFNPDTIRNAIIFTQDLPSVGDSLSVEPSLEFFDASISVSEDFEAKYDIIFYIGKNDGNRVGPYRIDPKIRLPRR